MTNIAPSGMSGQGSARVLALIGAAALLLSGCTATTVPTADPEVTSTPAGSPSGWSPEDAQWDKVLREFPDASRPGAEFIEWVSLDASIGMGKLVDCLNATSTPSPEDKAVADYICFVQYPEKTVYPTQEANRNP